ncbi:MAG: hypothetical protein U0414_29310 [Polyangiaceae bacterium]
MRGAFFPGLGLSVVLALAVACSTSGTDGAGAGSSQGSDPFGEVHEGDYHLGPVDWAETAFHNSCAPYPDEIEGLYGDYLAGVDNSLNGDGELCDACAQITTKLGKQITVHIVTTGVSNHPGDMDLSPSAYDAIYQMDPSGTSEHPRPMTWQLVKCPDLGTISYQFQTGANPYWTSLWVRNPRLPLAKVEVKSANHPSFTALDRGSDGTYTDNAGFGEGPFQIKLTSLDGQEVTSSFQGFEPGELAASNEQFE